MKSLRLGVGLSIDDPRHGKASTYIHHKCRCESCREAAWAARREYEHRAGRALPWAEHVARRSQLPPHGTKTRYGGKHRCRCELCRAAAKLARALHRQTNLAELRAYERAYMRRWRGREGSYGDEDTAVIRRHETLVLACSEAEGELAELVRAQQKDDSYRIGQRGWLVSLDEPTKHGRNRHELIGAPDEALVARESDS